MSLNKDINSLSYRELLTEIRYAEQKTDQRNSDNTWREIKIYQERLEKLYNALKNMK